MQVGQGLPENCTWPFAHLDIVPVPLLAKALRTAAHSWAQALPDGDGAKERSNSSRMASGNVSWTLAGAARTAP
ncbi:MAG TPA: hypothetical protein VF229_03365, partial [Burkholderiaceae bacterium]